MRRYSFRTLTNNADAAAVETARAALTAASGQPVIGGSKVTLQASVVNEAFVLGNMLGFARMPSAANADGTVSAWVWARWPGGDMDLNNVGYTDGVLKETTAPIGAAAVIALPLAIQSTGTATSVVLGIFTQAPFLG